MIPPTLTTRLNKLNANCVFRVFGATFKEFVQPRIVDSNGTVLREEEPTGRIFQVSAGHVECDIVDRTMNPGRDGQLRYESYATGKGPDEIRALTDALDKAEKQTKPLTPAQRADIEAGRIIDPNAKKLISELQRELADLRSKVQTQSKKPNTV